MSTQLDNEIISSMQEALDYASAKTNQAEIMLGRSESFSLTVDQGKIDKYQISNARSIGVRVINNHKVGISYTENLNQESLHEMVDLAIQNATFMKEDHFQKIITPAGSKKLINVHEKNFSNDKTETSKKIELCLSLESEVKKLDSRIKSSPYNNYSEGAAESYILNSEGLLSYERSRNFSCYTSCLMEAGEKTGMFYKGMSARTFNELNVSKIANFSYTIAKGLLEAGPISSGKYDVVFSTDCLQDFLGSFSVIYSAKSTAEGKNPFKDKLGKQVFSNLLSINDLPQFKQASYFHLFDDEGSVMEDLCLIQNGVLNSFYHNSATANELKQKNNARASRSTKGQLGVGGTTKVISTGTTMEEDLLKNPYLEIVAMQGLSSGSNAISGDFSFAISGFYHKDSDIMAFKGITLSGNFYKILKDQIAEIGDVLHANTYNGFFSPKIRFKDLSVSGS